MLDESVTSAPTFWAGLYSWFTPTVFFVVLQLVIGTIYITSTLANGARKQHQNQHQHQHWEQDPQGPDFPNPQQPLARSPSLLQRLKSINFYHPSGSHDPHLHNNNNPQFHNHQHQQEREHTQLVRSPSVLQRLKSINLYSYFPTEPFSSRLATDANVSNATLETHAPQKQHVRDAPVAETDEECDDVGRIQDNLRGHEEGSSLDEIYSQLQGQGVHFARQHSDTKPESGEVPAKLPRKMKKSASTKSAFSHFEEDDIVESLRPATVREAKVSAAAADDDGVDAKADDFINKFKQQLKLQRLDSIMRYKEMIGRGTAK